MKTKKSYQGYVNLLEEIQELINGAYIIVREHKPRGKAKKAIKEEWLQKAEKYIE